MALLYRFTHSAPVLNQLSSSVPPKTLSLIPPTPPESTDRVNALEYVDRSLSILGHLQQDQDSILNREFKQQQEFIHDKFEQQQYDKGQRDATVDGKFTTLDTRLDNLDRRLKEFDKEVGQRFDKTDLVLEEFRERFDKTDQRLQEQQAAKFNHLAHRPRDTVHAVAIWRKGKGLEFPDVKVFPRTVREFWRLRNHNKAEARSYLIQFYSIDFSTWHYGDEESDSEANSDSHSEADSTESLTLEEAAKSYPSKFLEALAGRLGLTATYERIKKLDQQSPTARPSKRAQEFSETQEDRAAKKAHLKSQQRVQIPYNTDSQSASTIPDTVSLQHRPRERAQAQTPEVETYSPTEAISSTKLREAAKRFF